VTLRNVFSNYLIIYIYFLLIFNYIIIILFNLYLFFDTIEINKLIRAIKFVFQGEDPINVDKLN